MTTSPLRRSLLGRLIVVLFLGGYNIISAFHSWSVAMGWVTVPVTPAGTGIGFLATLVFTSLMLVMWVFE